ncbi:magnesium transporter CorA family protein [Candidatus Kaiserbacteria bacterium]|nr:magnesium transporter CorA family protein [Candidatus Kaiserbacteria bacterium]
MIFRHAYREGVWVDLEQPSEDEIRDVIREFSISSSFEKEMLSPTPAALVAGDAGMTLLVLHFPAHGEDDDTKSQEVDFIVGDRFIVTIRYEVVAPLYHLKKLLEAQTLVEKKNLITTDILLEILFAHLYASVRDHTDHILDKLARVERDMFDGRERTTIRSISNISREFLHMEATLANQEDSLARFLKMLAGRDAFGPAFAERAERVLAQREQAARLVATHRAVAAELRETNSALLGSRQNEIMKTLTTVNFIFLPLGLITWTFAMRTEGTPLIDSPNAFWIVIGIMLGVAALLTAFFARKRWIF